MIAGREVPAPIVWEEKIKVASGGGYQGPWKMNASVYDYVDDPTVAMNRQGLIGVAWADQARKDVFLQIYTREGKAKFANPVNVSGTPRIFSWLPRMVMTDADPVRVYLLWQEIVFSGGSHGGEIFFAKSEDGGKTFEGPLNLSHDIAGSGKGRLNPEYWHNGSLDLARGSGGNLYAAWTEYEGSLWFARSADDGESFSQPLRIEGGKGGKPARAPSLAAGEAGTVYLAWTVGEDRAADIRFSKSVDSGRSFSPPEIAVQSDGHSDAPKITVDSRGTVHLAYAESPGGPLKQYRIHYTRLMDEMNAFETPKIISNVQTEQFESANFPYLSLGREGHLYVVWELFPGSAVWDLFPGPQNRPQGLGFTHSKDSGRTFSAPSVIPGSLDPQLGVNGSLQGLLMRKLAVNHSGKIAVVNSTFTGNEKSGVWLFRAELS